MKGVGGVAGVASGRASGASRCRGYGRGSDLVIVAAAAAEVVAAAAVVIVPVTGL